MWHSATEAPIIVSYRLPNQQIGSRSEADLQYNNNDARLFSGQRLFLSHKMFIHHVWPLTVFHSFNFVRKMVIFTLTTTVFTPSRISFLWRRFLWILFYRCYLFFLSASQMRGTSPSIEMISCPETAKVAHASISLEFWAFWYILYWTWKRLKPKVLCHDWSLRSETVFLPPSFSLFLRLRNRQFENQRTPSFPVWSKFLCQGG